MSSSDSHLAYLSLAEQFYQREIHENDLARAVIPLPSLDLNSLTLLSDAAEKAAFTHPRQGWSICRVAEIACKKQKCDPFTQAMSAWYLARAASAWEAPQKLAFAVHSARQKFASLNEPGWVAACDWLAESIHIIHENYETSANNLQEALVRLKAAGFEPLYYQCLLSLAWEKNAQDQFTETQILLDECEPYFTSQNQRLDLARCWRVRTRILTKQNRFDEAKEYAARAQKVFTSLNSQPDLGRILHALGTLIMYSTTDLEKTDAIFRRAEEIFSSCEMDLMLADTLMYRSMLYLQVGNLPQASQFINKAQKSFIKYKSINRNADCFTLMGLIEQEQGNIEKSINDFSFALKLRKQNQRLISLGTDLFNLGNAYAKAGRYQQALQNLEASVEYNSQVKFPSRTGLSEMYLARIWLQLKNLPNALDHLDRAQEILQVSNQADSQVAIARIRARIFFELGNAGKSQEYLQTALTISSQNNIPAQAALTERLLGEVLIYQTSFAEARQHLQTAYSAFSALKMQLEGAYCLVSLGRAFFLTRDFAAARNYYSKALALSKGDYKEIEWRIKSGLAEMEVLEKQPAEALKHYREAIHEISSIRNGLWQASLAGSFAQDPEVAFQNAIPLALELHAPEDALAFIEADKAVTLINQMTLPGRKPVSRPEKELLELKSEIDRIQQQMRVNPEGNASLQSMMQLRNLRKDLQTKSRRYETLISRLERKGSTSSSPGANRSFSLARFRERAALCCGQDWIALDYYCTGDALILVMVTPAEVSALRTPLTTRLTQALQACQQGSQGPSAGDLEILGETLLPPAVAEHLHTTTRLLIAPHQELHTLPWASLGKVPLVERAIPSLVHSFRTFELLCERSKLNVPVEHEKNGLLIGISKFNGLHPDLPFVQEEILALQPRVGKSGRVLQEENASVAILAQLSNPDREKGSVGLRDYNWLHVASHFFSDPASGYLSGIALSDETLWLDQIRDLAPLPNLITFSGCSSIFSRILNGDEHIGLPSTCFISGADTVIGSVWPVVDESSARLMTRFYRHYLSGQRPAQALALAQRETIREAGERSAWAGFACLGIP